MSDTKSRVNWAMVCHLAGLATYIGIPFGNIIAPFIVWQLKKDSSSFVDEQGKEAVNFNISFTIYGVAAGFLCYFLIGFIFMPIIFAAHIALAIWAALLTNKGKSVHYPLTLRFIN
jgi:uncharacterized Tic20 family protein